MTIFNSLLGTPEMLDGAFPHRANVSAAAIKTLTGTSTNGMYWITVGGVATQVYCNMADDGGGWMLAAKTINNNTRWYYDDPYWTNTTLLNDTQDPITFNGHIKTKIYTSVPFTRVRLCAGSISNGLVENWTSTSFNTMMNTRQTSSNSKATWINWMTTALGSAPDIQPFCNFFGTNWTTNYMYVRIGAGFNNENDCNTNDSGLGWGLKGIAPWTNNVAFGTTNAANSVTSTGYIFVR